MQKFEIKKFSCVARAFFATLVVFGTGLHAQTIVPGAMPGGFAVSPSGASTYKIPIPVPPGVAGMQPSLSLDYSSTAGNGIAGMGWSIGGTGAVTRCPKTLMHDGVRGTVNFDENDRFCLDGERLLLVSGNYGALNSEYRTEKDGFSQIVITATLGGANGPSEFRVRTKSGVTMRYGASPSSSHIIYVPLSNTFVNASWALSSIADVKGNTVSFNYVDQKLVRAEYGANVVDFVYENRLDREERIQGPLRVVQDQRLSKVVTSVPSASGMAVANTLSLTYYPSIETNRSMLSEVKVCAGPDDATRTCLQPTSFEWTSTYGRPSQSWPSGVEFGTEAWELADLFGDGRQVYYSRNGTTHYARRLNEDGTSQNWKWIGGQSAFSANNGFTGLVDLFGDGKQVFYSNDGYGNHVVTRFFESQTSQNLNYQTQVQWDNEGQPQSFLNGQVLDLFGDGRRVFLSEGAWGIHRAFRFKLDQTVDELSWSVPWINYTAPVASVMADLFGDGRPLHYRFYQSGGHYATRFNADLTTENYVWSGGHSLPANVEWTMADLFGEGRKMLYTRQGNVHQATRLSAKNSGGSAEKWEWSGLNASVGGVRVADLFGGGRDLFYTFDRAGKHYANRFSPASILPETFSWTEVISTPIGGGSVTGSSGSAGGFFMASPNTPWYLLDLQGDGRKIPYTRDGTNHYALKLFENNTMKQLNWIGHGEGDRGSTVGDLFGDGANVYFTHNSSGQQFMTGLSTGFFDLLKAVKPGGYWSYTPRQIEYARITKPNIYTKDTNAVYPRADVNIPLTVVSSVKVRSTPSFGGPDNESKYKYGGLKVDQQSGRGLLGFRWMEASEVETGITVRTEFMQDWPFIGLPKYSATTLQKGSVALLKQSDVTYTSINTTGVGGTCISNAPCFTFAQNTTEQSWDLNGSVLPLTTSTVAYDNYGNVTNMTVSSSFAGQTSSKTTTNVFKAPDLANWILGRIERATVTSTAPTAGLAAGIGVTPLGAGGAPGTPPSTSPGVNLLWLPAVLNLLLN